MATKKRTRLPSTGAAFAFPIGDGKYSVCRVLLDQDSKRSKKDGGHSILVAWSAWFGSRIPSVDEPELRPILHPTHHAWESEPCVVWVSAQVPAEYILIGNIVPTLKEQNIPCRGFGRWEGQTGQALLQWRWDHEREAVLAEEAAEVGREAQARKQALQERERYLNQVTLEELRERVFFPSWDTYPPRDVIDASRRIMTNTVERLLLLGKQAPEEHRMEVLRECIESFNKLDSQKDHFIETVEREDICKEFEAIAYAAGFGSVEDLADRWRDW